MQICFLMTSEAQDKILPLHIRVNTLLLFSEYNYRYAEKDIRNSELYRYLKSSIGDRTMSVC